ncbi:hypothetical protein BY996DRAFT_6408559 [Phakopsora pachyrhizi]|nr:hypothetical protein BY996DRAFT_6408559 [Phakopsora pachyrhizi]
MPLASAVCSTPREAQSRLRSEFWCLRAGGKGVSERLELEDGGPPCEMIARVLWLPQFLNRTETGREMIDCPNDESAAGLFQIYESVSIDKRFGQKGNDYKWISWGDRRYHPIFLSRSKLELYNGV